MELSKLSKTEKIDLIKRIQAGDVPLIINGQIIGNGVILIKKEGDFYLDGSKINMEEFKEKFKGTAIIILPHNGRNGI
jgi:hypothetical protein